jgi:hypothetical protein
MVRRVLEDIERYDVRGTMECFREIPSDLFDGHYFRHELEDLVRRRLLQVIEFGFDDSLGRDPLRNSDRRLCGVGWSVYATERLIRALCPHRLVA